MPTVGTTGGATVTTATADGEGREERSIYDGFTYRPIRKAPRKNAHERTVGHEWRHTKCGRVVHTEVRLDAADEEFEEQASQRHLRINEAVRRHQCPKDEEDVNE